MIKSIVANKNTNDESSLKINEISNFLSDVENMDLFDNNSEIDMLGERTAEEEEQLLDLLGKYYFEGLGKKSVKQIIWEDGQIRLITVDNETFIVDRSTFDITDILDEYGNSVVIALDMFSDDAESYGMYGGNQGDLLNSSKYYSPTALAIINKYFPDWDYSVEELGRLFRKMGDTGCGYVGIGNSIFNNTANLTDEEFYDTFGFNRYTIRRVYNAETNSYEYVKTYNYNDMFLDVYLYHQVNDEHFTAIPQMYGDPEYFYDYWVERLKKEYGCSQEEAEKWADYYKENNFVVHADGLTWGEDTDIYSDYLNDKGINVGAYNCRSADYERRANTLANTIHGAVTPEELLQSDIETALENGNEVIISMSNFPMYLTYDADGNGLLDDVATGLGGQLDSVGSHAMSVTGIAEDGAYYVSSWGNEYIVRPGFGDNFREIAILEEGNN